MARFPICNRHFPRRALSNANLNDHACPRAWMISFAKPKRASLVAILALVLCDVSPSRAETFKWTELCGSSDDGFRLRVALDGLGNVYLSGSTDGSVDGIANHRCDSFQAKLGIDLFELRGIVICNQALVATFSADLFVLGIFPAIVAGFGLAPGAKT